MKSIIITVTDIDAKMIETFLRSGYGSTADLDRLCEVAVRREVARIANDEALAALNNLEAIEARPSNPAEALDDNDLINLRESRAATELRNEVHSTGTGYYRGYKITQKEDRFVATVSGVVISEHASLIELAADLDARKDQPIIPAGSPESASALALAEDGLVERPDGLGHRLYGLLEIALKQSGSLDPEETLPYISEQLTGIEFRMLHQFLEWLRFNNLTIGSANYEERFKAFWPADRVDQVEK